MVCPDIRGVVGIVESNSAHFSGLCLPKDAVSLISVVSPSRLKPASCLTESRPVTSATVGPEEPSDVCGVITGRVSATYVDVASVQRGRPAAAAEGEAPPVVSDAF